jgi:uncharacterized protein (TIRG00374 family)
VRGRFLLWIALPLALAWAMRGVSVQQVLQGLRQLTLGEILALAAVNLLVVLAFSGRWWTLLRAQGHRLPYVSLSAYRLAAFAISYFTPGTHFGGEPLQVHLVHRRHGVPLPRATASVVLDKAIELIANFAFLAIGLATVVRLGVQPAGSTLVLRAASLALLVLPALYLAAVWRGHRPASLLLSRLDSGSDETSRRRRLVGWAKATEAEVGSAARGSPRGVLAAGAFTVLSWLLLLAEWGLALQFLDIHLTAAEVIAVVTAARLALFVPLPGAAGALEAGLVLSLTTLGVETSQALSLAVVIRVRDVAFGAVGLWLGGWLADRPGTAQPAPGAD